MKKLLFTGFITLMGLKMSLAQNSWSSTSKGFVVNVNGRYIKVADAEFPKKMTWDNEVAAVAALGEGWRLPFPEELKAMYQQLHVNVKGDFEENDSYWSKLGYYRYPSEDFDTTTIAASSFSFESGSEERVYSNSKLYVRAMRELTPIEFIEEYFPDAIKIHVDCKEQSGDFLYKIIQQGTGDKVINGTYIRYKGSRSNPITKKVFQTWEVKHSYDRLKELPWGGVFFNMNVGTVITWISYTDIDAFIYMEGKKWAPGGEGVDAINWEILEIRNYKF